MPDYCNVMAKKYWLTAHRVYLGNRCKVSQHFFAITVELKLLHFSDKSKLMNIDFRKLENEGVIFLGENLF